MHLRETSRSILDQLQYLLVQMNPAEYSAPLDLLSGNSVGKHMRHIIEFFDLLVNHFEDATLNYDNRRHDAELEANPAALDDKIGTIKDKLSSLTYDKDIWLEASYNTHSSDPEQIKSSFKRELAYNIEHAVHHMAIIKIAVLAIFPKIELPENFGVAYSTIRYKQSAEQ